MGLGAHGQDTEAQGTWGAGHPPTLFGLLKQMVALRPSNVGAGTGRTVARVAPARRVAARAPGSRTVPTCQACVFIFNTIHTPPEGPTAKRGVEISGGDRVRYHVISRLGG